MVSQAVMTMPKKKSTTDGRRTRYEPLTVRELQEAAKALFEMAGSLEAAALEVKEMGLQGVQIDGRNMLQDSISSLRVVVRRAKTSLYEERLARE